MRRSVLLTLVAALTLATFAPASYAAAEGPGHVVSVAVDPGPFVVDGKAGQAQATITAVIDEPSFVIGTQQLVEWRYTGVEAVLQRISGGAPAVVSVDLPRVATAGSVGTFSAPWRIAASRQGVWALTLLQWGAMGPAVDPRVALGETRTVTVGGSRAPSARIGYVPRAMPYGSSYSLPMRATATYFSASGAPLVGARVLVGTEYACFADPVPPSRGGVRGFRALRTDGLGQVTITLSDLPACVFLLGPPAVPGDEWSRALIRHDVAERHYFYRWVSALPTSRSIRVGRTLTVVGGASPATGVARLQRLVGRTWRTVSTARVRPSGRYTTVVLMPARGRAYYRVVVLDTPVHPRSTLLPISSRALLVRGV